MRATLLGMIVFLAASTVLADGLSRLDELAAEAGKDATALVKLGDLYVEAMRLTEAKKAYKNALKLEKKFGEAQFGLARIDMAKRKFKPAKNACRKVARAHKDSSVGDVCSGWFWISNDRSARAIDEFEKAIQKGDIARGKTGMGEALRRRGDYDDSIKAYKEAISAGAGYVAQIGLGLALEINEDKTGATQAFEKAVTMQPASCQAQFNYGRMLKPGPKAVSHLEAALSIRAGWLRAYVALGDVHIATGNLEAAVKAFQGAIASKAGRGVAFFGLGRALHMMDKNKKALEALNKTIELIPNHMGAHLLIAQIQYELGETQVAIDALEKARTAAPGDVKVYIRSGEIYYRMERYTSARSFLNQAVSMNNKLSRAHVLLGKIACERRLYAAGKQHYKRALEGNMAKVKKSEITKLTQECKPKMKKK
ncbi:MAG: tetratricopeptide repeat protein [Deltaproteobacteria bacterium]|nr:tetratricopeptide repeat protein [Deltaproteobacteria bacterium]